MTSCTAPVSLTAFMRLSVTSTREPSDLQKSSSLLHSKFFPRGPESRLKRGQSLPRGGLNLGIKKTWLQILPLFLTGCGTLTGFLTSLALTSLCGKWTCCYVWRAGHGTKHIAGAQLLFAQLCLGSVQCRSTHDVSVGCQVEQKCHPCSCGDQSKLSCPWPCTSIPRRLSFHLESSGDDSNFCAW
jgi:hypothetical protein